MILINLSKYYITIPRKLNAKVHQEQQIFIQVPNVHNIQWYVCIGYIYIASYINICPLLRGTLNHKNIYIKIEQIMYKFRPPSYVSLVSLLLRDVPAEALDDGTVAIVSAESLPEVQSHINRVERVSVSNSSLSSNAVVGHGDDLGAELVVLSSAVLVEDRGGHGDQRHVGINCVGEVGAETTSTNGVQRLASRSWVTKLEDRALHVVAGSDNVLALAVGSSRGGDSQHKSGDGE